MRVHGVMKCSQSKMNNKLHICLVNVVLNSSVFYVFVEYLTESTRVEEQVKLVELHGHSVKKRQGNRVITPRETLIDDNYVKQRKL